MGDWPCPCCGAPTSGGPGSFDICPVCFWEDDGCAPGDESGANRGLTVEEGRACFERLGACDPEFVHSVRPAAASEGAYDRFPRAPLWPGVALGWIGDGLEGPPPVDGFLCDDEGRRVGFRIGVDRSHTGPPACRPSEVLGPGRVEQFDVVVAPGSGAPTLGVLAGVLEEMVAALRRAPLLVSDTLQVRPVGPTTPAAVEPPPGWAPALVPAGWQSISGAGGGGGMVNVEATADDPALVRAWLAATVPAGAVEEAPGRWVHREDVDGWRRSASSELVLPDREGRWLAPAPSVDAPPGTRCLVVRTTFAVPVSGP